MNDRARQENHLYQNIRIRSEISIGGNRTHLGEISQLAHFSSVIGMCKKSVIWPIEMQLMPPTSLLSML